ncbi:hypothetical protein HGRIS_010838 [Hohenbuehelia grisea]|uniref:Uncharacterized protein n=1 Tax=Hohenbuehelia grisea TaxID=104357 RepID=A0ABR3IYA3_9AGAR
MVAVSWTSARCANCKREFLFLREFCQRLSYCIKIRTRVTAIFRQTRYLTGTAATKVQLVKCYKLLDVFRAAKAGDVHMQNILHRYDRLIKARAENDHMKHLILKDIAWRNKLRNRPIMTGSFLRASLANKPLPRLRPQPIAISMMIRKRRAARERRSERQKTVNEWLEDMKLERYFEETLSTITGGEFHGVYAKSNREWLEPLYQLRSGIQETFDRDLARSETPIPPNLITAIKAARRERVANKTRERARERAGVTLPRTLRRQRKGPPAHVLCKMSPAQRRMDKVVRSISEVGYIGEMKRRLGFKLREPDKWRVEIGKEEDEGHLRKEVQRVEAENLRRRRLIEQRGQVADE